MVARWLLAIVLCMAAAACAGFTGMFFEESKIQLSEGKAKSAAQYTARSIGMALSAFALAYIGIRLVQR